MDTKFLPLWKIARLQDTNGILLKRNFANYFLLDDRHFLTCHTAARYANEAVPVRLGISL